MSIKVLEAISRPMFIAGLLGLFGCATPPPMLYGWGSYQQQVYEYLKGENNGPQAQLAALETDLQQFDAKGLAHPPGLHAHIGLLYASMGKSADAVQEFETEKSLFPESAQYIDFLLSNKR